MKLACALLTALALCFITGTARSIQKDAGEQTIDLKKVPKAVIIEFKREYPKAVIKEDRTEFEVILKSGTETLEVAYAADGTRVKKEKK